MTNNRKPVDEIRLSLSAAREDDSQPLHIATEGSLNQLPTKHRKGWTPAPTKPAYSQTNVSLAHKGRDYDAILRAAKKAPVGYWEDAPSGIKFGSGDTRSVNPPLRANAGSTPAAPTPPQSGDGPWPKCAYASAETNRWHSGEIVAVYEDADDGGTCYFDSGHAQCCSQSYECNISTGGFVPIALANAIPKLEQNGHKDVAAQLRGKGDDVATVRVTISTAPRADVDCKTRCELKQTYVKIEMATGLIIPCDETDPDKIGYVR